MNEDTRMYIAVLDEFPDYMVPTLVAHTILTAHIIFNTNKDYGNWLKYSFRKCVIRVNQKEFDRIKTLDNIYIGHENKTLDGKDSCIVICPREENPNVLKFAKLWKPKCE